MAYTAGKTFVQLCDGNPSGSLFYLCAISTIDTHHQKVGQERVAVLTAVTEVTIANLAQRLPLPMFRLK